MKTSGQFLSTATVAKRCGVTAKTVARWVDSGILPAVFTSGGHRRIKATDMELFLANRRSLKSLQSPDGDYRILVLTRNNAFKAITNSVARHKGAQVTIVETVFDAGLAVATFCPLLAVIDTSLSGESTTAMIASCEHHSKVTKLHWLLVGPLIVPRNKGHVHSIGHLDHGTFESYLEKLSDC